MRRCWKTRRTEPDAQPHFCPYPGKHGSSIETIRALQCIDTGISAEPMPFDCERVVDSSFGSLRPLGNGEHSMQDFVVLSLCIATPRVRRARLPARWRKQWTTSSSSWWKKEWSRRTISASASSPSDKTCRLQMRSNFGVLVDALDSYFKERQPDLTWIQQA